MDRSRPNQCDLHGHTSDPISPEVLGQIGELLLVEEGDVVGNVSRKTAIPHGHPGVP